MRFWGKNTDKGGKRSEHNVRSAVVLQVNGWDVLFQLSPLPTGNGSMLSCSVYDLHVGCVTKTISVKSDSRFGLPDGIEKDLFEYGRKLVEVTDKIRELLHLAVPPPPFGPASQVSDFLIAVAKKYGVIIQSPYGYDILKMTSESVGRYQRGVASGEVPMSHKPPEDARGPQQSAPQPQPPQPAPASVTNIDKKKLH